jgi:hypothetical protein
MPYCPGCRCEYLTEISTCAGCRVALVAELPSSTLRPGRGLVAVYSGPYLEVGMLREALHGRGIATLLYLSDPDPGVFDRFLSTPRFADLLVAREDAEARQPEIEECLDFVTPRADAESTSGPETRRGVSRS